MIWKLLLKEVFPLDRLIPQCGCLISGEPIRMWITSCHTMIMPSNISCMASNIWKQLPVTQRSWQWPKASTDLQPWADPGVWSGFANRCSTMLLLARGCMCTEYRIYNQSLIERHCVLPLPLLPHQGLRHQIHFVAWQPCPVYGAAYFAFSPPILHAALSAREH